MNNGADRYNTGDTLKTCLYIRDFGDTNKYLWPCF